MKLENGYNLQKRAYWRIPLAHKSNHTHSLKKQVPQKIFPRHRLPVIYIVSKEAMLLAFAIQKDDLVEIFSE